MKNIKEKIYNKNLIYIVFTIIVVILVLGFFKVNLSNPKKWTAKLTQLQDNGDRQMMGYFIRTSSGKNIVIDGGTTDDAENLKSYIIKYGGKVDYWFLTHPHDDHIGAFLQLINDENINIDNVYYSLNSIEWYEENDNSRSETAIELYDDIKNKENINFEETILNENINIDDKIKYEILGIANPEITNNAGNNSSMVIKMILQENKVIFLGDTGTESSEKLLNTQYDKLDANIVQVAHHGQNGATKELYQRIKPTVCLWPTPEWLWNNDNGGGYNSGSWKTLETRSWMEEIGVKTNIIEKDGDITIELY